MSYNHISLLRLVSKWRKLKSPCGNTLLSEFSSFLGAFAKWLKATSSLITSYYFSIATVVAQRRLNATLHVHSVGQKSIGLKFSKSRTGSGVRYSCHHNSSPPSRSLTVQNKQPSTCSSWLVVACKVTYPSRLHNKRLSVYPHPSCLR